DIQEKWWGPRRPTTPGRAALLSGETRPLTIGQPVHAKVFCSGHPAIATDYRGGSIDPREPTVPKDGLAIAGTVKLLPIIDTSVHQPDAKEAVAAHTARAHKA